MSHLSDSKFEVCHMRIFFKPLQCQSQLGVWQVNQLNFQYYVCLHGHHNLIDFEVQPLSKKHQNSKLVWCFSIQASNTPAPWKSFGDIQKLIQKIDNSPMLSKMEVGSQGEHDKHVL